MQTTRYAIITPRDGEPAPANTGRGWQFPFDSQWHAIGEDKPLSEELAIHAEAFFTRVDPDTKLPVCSVNVEWHEGTLTLVPTGKTERPRFECRQPGCGKHFFSVDKFSEHVAECALKTAEARIREQPAGEGEGNRPEGGD